MKNKVISLSITLMLLLSMLTFALNVKTVKSDPGNTFVVPDDKPTIQAAIDAASDGDIILVRAIQTYNEAININKALQLYSIDGSAIIDGSGITPTSAGLVGITASGNVIFDGFTVKQNPALGDTEVGIGIYAHSSLAGPTYTIIHNIIYGTNNPDCEQDYGFYPSYGKEKVVFSHNLITQTGSNNIVVEQHADAIEISHNTLDTGCWGIDPIFIMAYGGLAVTTLQNVSYNTFDMGTGTQFEYGATGISICTPGNAWGIGEATFTNVVISGNVFNNLKDRRRGIGTWNANNNSHNLFGLQIIGNTINGVPGSTESFGIDFYGLTDNANITGNTITSTDTAIYLRDGTAPGTQIHHNNIVGNTVGLNWTIGDTIDARFNWWGNPTGPYDPLLNPSGLGDHTSGNVDFEPWLIAAYPPATEVEALLYINPANVEYWTVSCGKTFTVDVKLDDVTNLWSFEFKVYWNTTLLDLVNVQKMPPWSSSSVGTDVLQEDLGRYYLGITATQPAQPFSGSTTLARLTFKITYDPIYPTNVTCKLNLADSILVGPGPQFTPIYHMEHDGKYTIYSTRPKIDVNPATYASHILGETFTIKINATDVVNLYEFSVQLDFNPTLLNVVSNGLQIGSFLNSPIIMQSNYDNVGGHILLHASAGIGAPPSNGTGTLATITFQVKSASLWRFNHANILTCTLHLHDTMLKTNTGIQVSHDNIDGTYQYVPKPGDLNYDGHVGLDDLRIVGYWYNPHYDTVADLNEDGIVNIVDLGIVGWYYGEDC